MLTFRVLSLFCSNPEDFGIEGGEKDHIFNSLKNITKLPSTPPKGDDRLDDSVVQTAGSPSAGGGKVQEENLGRTPLRLVRRRTWLKSLMLVAQVSSI